MIDTPQIVQTAAQTTATIHLTVSCAEIQKVMGPAIGEVLAAVAAQGLVPAGAVFSYHYRKPTDSFDFEVGVPVAKPFAATGRVKPSELRARKVARTVYTGGYERLGPAWGEFSAWIKAQNLEPVGDFWEAYLSGPADDPNPAMWRTELTCPLK